MKALANGFMGCLGVGLAIFLVMLLLYTIGSK